MKPSSFQLSQIHITLMAQFSEIQPEMILGAVDVKISKKTQRIKSVYCIVDNEKILLFSLRTSDGHFLPTFEAARRILASGYNGNRVYVDDEAVPFVSRGKTAFCKYITKVDKNIYPKSIVFLLDKSEHLLAVGSAVQPGYAMLELQSGAGVNIRYYDKSANR